MMWVSGVPRSLACSGAVAALIGLAGFALPAAAQSACSVTVTSLADSGDGTLRNAIAVAAASGAVNICFQSGLQGTITLASTLQITSAVSIAGPNLPASGVPAIVISGNGSVQPVLINALDDSGYALPVSIAAIEITGGNGKIGGGVWVAGGIVTLNQMTITGNSAEAGGGVYNEGTLTMTSCQVTSNQSMNGLGGGIVNLQGGSLTLQSTNVTSNNSDIADGGGIASSGTLVIQSGSIANNNANGPDGGGGLFINGGTTTISAGAIVSANTVTSQGADGAGLYNSGATVFITASAFLQNVVSGSGPQFGGAIFNTGTLSASESTFAGNSAITSGGGIYSNTSLDQNTTLTLNSVTISNNTSTGGAGGGVENVINEAPSLTMNNVIVAGNTAQSGTADCDGCGNATGVANTIGGASGLGPLADNGGPTQSMMPLPGGPEIGAGNASVNQDQQDQRGLSRLSNGTIDRGAVQDHYSSVSFYQQPTNAQENRTITPAVEVQVVEQDGSTTNYPHGVPVTMELIPTVGMQSEGSLNGTLVQYPTNGAVIAAVFPDLSVTAAGSWELVATTYPTSQDGQMATYSATSNAFTTTAPLTMTQTALSIVPLSPTYGQALLLTATVTESGTGAPVQTGSVTFTDNGASLVTTPVTNGIASAGGVVPTVGQHVFVATYGGSSTDGVSGGSETIMVAKATPVVSLATPGRVLPGALVSLANVHGTATGVGGAQLVGTFGYSPALGTALTSGETVTVTFTPTDTTDYVSGSASTTLTVLGAQTTTTTLTPSVNPVLPGVGVSLTASVSPAPGTAGAVPGTEAFSVTSPSSAIASARLALDPTTANFTASPVQTYSGSFEYNTYSADFNGDGVADLLVVPSDGLPQLLLSIPGTAPSLATALPVNLGSTCSYTIGLTVGDVNGDGLPDIAAACVNDQTSATTLVVVLNQGAGVFVPAPTVTTLSPGIGSVQMVLGNFIKTGAQGLVVLTDCYESSGCSSTLNYLQGDGAGNFTLVNYELINNAGTSDSFANLLAADFNGDGYADVAFLHASDASPLGVVEVWTNSGGSQPTFGQLISAQGQTYATSTTITAGDGSSSLLSLVSADLNLDGKPDLALTTAVVTDGSGADAYSSISIALNQSTSGTVAFPAATTDTQGNGAVSTIATADFDGDGVPDIALYDSYNGTVRVLHGAVGQGGSYAFAFTEPNLLFTVAAPSNLPDSARPQVAGGRRRKAAGLRPADSVLNNLIYPVVAVGDTNGDGYPDLLIGQVTTDQSYNQSYQAQQFVTSGPTGAVAPVTAPNVTTGYTAATTPAPNPGYWAPSTGATTLNITSIATSTSLAVSPSSPVYGTPLTLNSQVINTATGAAAAGGSVTFSEDGAALTPTVALGANGKATFAIPLPTAGQHTFGASYSGATGESPSTATSSMVTVAKFTPTISWPVPAAITTTTPLSGTQLDATAIGLPGSTLALGGSFVYTPAAGATLPAGAQTLSVIFTPTDANDYATVSKTVQIQVSLTATRTAFTIAPASPTTYGQALTLAATVTNTTGSTVISGGTVTFTSDGVGIGSAGLVSGAASLPGVMLAAGTHTIAAAYSGTAVEGTSSAAGQVVQVNKATPTLTWATPAAITTTTPLSAAQLDAAVSGTTGDAGTFVYTPAAGTTLSAGTHTLSVTFTPTDGTDYSTATKTVQIQVNATNTQTLLTVAPLSSTYGTGLTLSASVTNTSGSAVVNGGTVTFTSDTTTVGSVTVVNGAASLTGVLLHGGTHQIGASYAGVSGELGSTAGAQTVQVAQATPTLTWATPAAITTTTPLSGTQLDAAAAGVNGAPPLAGTSVYTPAAGTVLSAGTHTLSVTFTPAVATDYSTASKTVQIQVSATVTRTTFTVSPASGSTYGQPLTLAAQVTNTTGTTPVQGGTVTFTSDGVAIGSAVTVNNGAATLSGVTLTAGTHTLDVAYSPVAGETGSTAASNQIAVGKATPTLTWPTPAAISSTTPLSAEQLDATAAGAGTTGALAGTFVYTPSSGTLAVGTHTLSVTFTPTDAVDYTTATATVQIQVVNTNTQTTFTVAPGSVTYGQTLTLSAQVVNTTGTATVGSGSVVFASDNVTLGTISVANGAASLSGVALGGGQHLLTASYAGAAGEGASAAAARTITVTKAAPVVTWPTPGPIASTTQLSGTQLDATSAGVTGAALPGVFTYAPASGTLTVGTHTLSVSFAPTDAVDYGTGTAQVSIQVVPETITLVSISPATTEVGTTPLAVTVTGSGFPAGAVVQLNGTTLATTAISATQLGVTVPGANLAKAGSLSFTIYDAASQAISNAAALSVTAPTATAMVSAPATTTSAQQPTVGLTLANSYPVDIAGTFTLTFAPAGQDGVDDPAVQFSSGGRTLNFTIPAGATTGPRASLQSGTVEGTISVATVLTAGGQDVTPVDLSTPAAISVAASVPTITGVTFTNANGLITVVVTGFSNTREMTEAGFVFNGPGATSLTSAGVTLPATSLFATWYTNADSATFGSTFLYTQTFQLSDDTTNITGVAVTLTNTVGTSTSVSSQ